MCGIAGQINFSKKKLRFNTGEMLGKIKHRGPDGTGSFADEMINFGMRRLSIIDIEGGDQPLYNEDKSIVIVGNGEIYNYIELQTDLRKKGHKFRTASDIEVAVHMYEEYGEQAWKKLRGMFALAIYDKRKSIFFLVRDRFGEKPIYFGRDSETFFFSSELKSVIVNLSKVELDMQAANLFSHYYFVKEPLTLVKGIKKIEAGSSLKIELKLGKISSKFYWHPDEIIPKDTNNLYSSIFETLGDACKLTLRSDVKVGLALSGGIDSSAILALTAPYYKDTLTAFSVGYKGRPETDERKMARDLAKKYKVTYFESEISDSDVVNDFPQLIFDCDEPIADIAAHSIREVYKLAHKNKVKVILGGIGGDELFWGYPSTIQSAIQNKKEFIGWRKLFGNPKHYLYNNPNPNNNNWLSMIGGDNFDVGDEDYLDPLVITKYPKDDTQIGIDSMSLLRENWLKGNCIAINDRLSMSASVELRSPFLDYKLADLAYGSQQIINGYKMPPKYYLKEALKGTLPTEILNRPKRGFTPPVGKWLKMIIDGYSYLLPDGYLIDQQVISGDKLKLYLGTIGKSPTNWYSIYQLLILEIWCRENILGEKPQDIRRRK